MLILSLRISVLNYFLAMSVSTRCTPPICLDASKRNLFTHSSTSMIKRVVVTLMEFLGIPMSMCMLHYLFAYHCLQMNGEIKSEILQ